MQTGLYLHQQPLLAVDVWRVVSEDSGLATGLSC